MEESGGDEKEWGAQEGGVAPTNVAALILFPRIAGGVARCRRRRCHRALTLHCLNHVEASRRSVLGWPIGRTWLCTGDERSMYTLGGGKMPPGALKGNVLALTTGNDEGVASMKALK